MNYCNLLRRLWFHAILLQFKEMKPKHHLPHTHIYLKKKVKWKKKCTCHLNKFILIICCHFFLFHMTVVYFFWDEDKHHPSPKAHDPKFHPKLVFSQIVLEQRPGIKKSFWGWFKPIYKDNRQFSPNQFWLFGSNSSRTKQTCQKQRPCLSPSSHWGKCPWKWPDLGAHLTSEALSLSPGKPSWALLRQGVVVGIFLWSIKQHLSVGDTQRRRVRDF